MSPTGLHLSDLKFGTQLETLKLVGCRRSDQAFLDSGVSLFCEALSDPENFEFIRISDHRVMAENQSSSLFCICIQNLT